MFYSKSVYFVYSKINQYLTSFLHLYFYVCLVEREGNKTEPILLIYFALRRLLFIEVLFFSTLFSADKPLCGCVYIVIIRCCFIIIYN